MLQVLEASLPRGLLTFSSLKATLSTELLESPVLIPHLFLSCFNFHCYVVEKILRVFYFLFFLYTMTVIIVLLIWTTEICYMWQIRCFNTIFDELFFLLCQALIPRSGSIRHGDYLFLTNVIISFMIK